MKEPDERRQLASARTLLLVPGHRPDRFAKAAAAGADGIVLDLEDAVAPDAKDAARSHVLAWLSEGAPASYGSTALPLPGTTGTWPPSRTGLAR